MSSSSAAPQAFCLTFHWMIFSGHGCPEGNHADSSYSLPEVLSSMTTLAAGHQLTSALHCSWIHQIPLRFRAQARSEDLLREVKCPVVQSWGLLGTENISCTRVPRADPCARYTVTGFQETHLAVFTAAWAEERMVKWCDWCHKVRFFMIYGRVQQYIIPYIYIYFWTI